MAVTFDGKYVEATVEKSKDDMEAILEGVRKALGLNAVGMAAPSDADLAAFFFHQQVMFPPETFVFPDGRTVTASPWILALGFCENGKEWLARFDRFRAKNGGA